MEKIVFSFIIMLVSGVVIDDFSKKFRFILATKSMDVTCGFR